MHVSYQRSAVASGELPAEIATSWPSRYLKMHVVGWAQVHCLGGGFVNDPWSLFTNLQTHVPDTGYVSTNILSCGSAGCGHFKGGVYVEGFMMALSTWVFFLICTRRTFKYYGCCQGATCNW